MKTYFNHLFWTNRPLITQGSLLRVKHAGPFFGHDKTTHPVAWGAMSGLDSGQFDYAFHHTEPDDFQPLIQDLYGRMHDGKELMVYLHGYSHSFNKLIGNVELFHRLYIDPPQSTIGHLLTFSWPSAGNFWQYHYDRDMCTASAQQLMNFARALHKYPSNLTEAQRAEFLSRVNLAAGSMGVFLLQEFAALWAREGDIRPTFNEVVQAGSDVPYDVYHHSGAMTSVPDLARRVHVYHSQKDNLLHRSRVVNGINRLGLSGWDKDTIDSDKLVFVDCLEPTVYTLNDRKYGKQRAERTYHTLHNYMERCPEIIEDIIEILKHEPEHGIKGRVTNPDTGAKTQGNLYKLLAQPDITERHKDDYPVWL